MCACQACEEWFARLRPLQLRLAAACGQHGATVFHACLHLLQLERQASALLAPPPAKPHTPAAVPAARHHPAATPAAESAAASAAESAAPLGEAEWPSLGATAAPAAPKETPTKPSAKEAKAAKRQAAKLRQPRKAVPLAVQPRILQRSDEAAPAARPEPASRPGGAPKLAGSGMGGKKSAQPAPSADVLARLEKLSREVLSTLRQVGSAICAMGDPDAIAGLHAHAIEAFAGLFAATRCAACLLFINFILTAASPSNVLSKDICGSLLPALFLEQISPGVPCPSALTCAMMYMQGPTSNTGLDGGHALRGRRKLPGSRAYLLGYSALCGHIYEGGGRRVRVQQSRRSICRHC